MRPTNVTSSISIIWRLYLETVCTYSRPMLRRSKRQYTGRKPPVNPAPAWPPDRRTQPWGLGSYLPQRSASGLRLACELEQTRAGRRMEGIQRMADRIASDDAAGRHDGLGRAQTALAILVVDERQDARVGRRRFAPAAARCSSTTGLMRSGSSALGIVPVAPASRSAISVIDSSPSNGPAMSVTARLDQRPQLGGRSRAPRS